MKKILAIASREFNAVIRSKAFIVSMVLLPVMMFSSFLVQRVSQKVHDVNDRHFAVIDRTPGAQLYAAIESATETRNKTETIDPETGKQIKSRFVIEKIDPAEGAAASEQQRFEVSQRVRGGVLFGVVEIGQDVLDAIVPENVVEPPMEKSVGYWTNNPTAMEFRELTARTVNREVRARRLRAAGVPEAKFAELQIPTRVLNRGLMYKDSSGAIVSGEASHDIVAFLVPLGLVMLMFMVVIIGAVPLLQGIAEEKQNRVAEVLLGSVSPFSLMAGKVLGLVATSFTLILFYLGGAYWAAHRMHVTEYLPTHVLACFVLFQLLAVLMYGSLYIAIGASCNDPNQMQSLLMPVNLIMALPLIMMVAIIQSPNGPLARIITYFPPATPFVATARMSVPPGMPMIEIVASIALVLLTTITLVWASGRIFRIGILMQGKSPHLGQLAKWVLKG